MYGIEDLYGTIAVVVVVVAVVGAVAFVISDFVDARTRPGLLPRAIALRTGREV